MTASPTVEDLTVRQGSREAIRFITRDLNGTLYEPTGFRMKARLGSYTGAVLFSYTNADPEVTLGEGFALLELDSTTTEPFAPGDYVYDTEARDPSSNDWTRIAEGKLCVTPNVTY